MSSVLQSPRLVSQVACPSSQELALLAAGLVPEGRSREILAHVAGCEGCGRTLRMASETVHEPEFGIAPAADYIAELARRLAQPKVREMPSRSSWIWQSAAAAALALVAGGLWWQSETSRPVETMLAQAYAERRPTEFRIPGAMPAEQRRERAAQKPLDRPSGLIDAEQQIVRALKQDPANVEALRWKARAEMLEFLPEEAISTFTRALETQPGHAGLLAELGAAYAQRAERDGTGGDWSEALDRLSLALRAEPSMSLALFNRALVYERLAMNAEAEADWQRYLSLDPRGEWAQEARKHLSDIEQKKNNGASQ